MYQQKMIYKLLVLAFFLLNSALSQNDIVLVENQETEETTSPAPESFLKAGSEEFVATHEWQSIKPDQSIPKGLHVRINLQTGEREAKLLDTSNEESELEKKRKSFEKSILELDDQTPQLDVLSKEYAEIKSKFRSYEEIKKEMADLDMFIKTENELMKELMNRYVNTTDTQEKMAILKDMEFYVHQYDNGILFCDMNGFELLTNELNSTRDIDLQVQIALVLGSAVQSNSKVQIFAMKFEFIQLMLNLLTRQSASRHLEAEYYPKLIFVLSGLLRNFPFAQNLFANKYGGIEVLSNLIKNVHSVKLKTKLLTFVNDLVQEKIDIEKIEKTNNTVTKIEQYQKILLLENLIEQKWCSNFEKILDGHLDHDSREKILTSVLTLVNACREDFKKSQFQALTNLRKEYNKLASEETDSDETYFSEILQLIENIIFNLRVNEEL